MAWFPGFPIADCLPRIASAANGQARVAGVAANKKAESRVFRKVFAFDARRNSNLLFSCIQPYRTVVYTVVRAPPARREHSTDVGWLTLAVDGSETFKNGTL